MEYTAKPLRESPTPLPKIIVQRMGPNPSFLFSLSVALVSPLLRSCRNYTIILPRLNGFQRALEMALGHLDCGGFLICLQI